VAGLAPARLHADLKMENSQTLAGNPKTLDSEALRH